MKGNESKEPLREMADDNKIETKEIEGIQEENEEEGRE
jgi:hypothetical protein